MALLGRVHGLGSRQPKQKGRMERRGGVDRQGCDCGPRREGEGKREKVRRGRPKACQAHAGKRKKGRREKRRCIEAGWDGPIREGVHRIHFVFSNS